MRRTSPKRAALNREVEPVRKQLREDVRMCEVCLIKREPHLLANHEICNGPLRRKALDKLFAQLVVCLNPIFRTNEHCHNTVQEESEVRQLARLMIVREKDYDLEAYLKLTNPRAPNRITQSEVDAEAANLLSLRPTVSTKDFS